MKKILIALGLSGLAVACVPVDGGYYGPSAAVVVSSPATYGYGYPYGYGYGYGYGYNRPAVAYGYGYRYGNYRRPVYYGGSRYARRYGARSGVRYGRSKYVPR
jgi:hypothetical protein